ncbi:unnamed protein product [Moneuplotes crassus]|uniref:Uncharacterized protein n=1 Tax=Euplotes crassus TaxID=5936 RepID=A0AAD1XKT5_EUPCR|nr:unnamed protein product [Moneuplotes crassus]
MQVESKEIEATAGEHLERNKALPTALDEESVMSFLKMGLSFNRDERAHAQGFFQVAEECKLDKQTESLPFYLLLVEMIKKYQAIISENTESQEEDQKWQFQLILLLKNSLKRNLGKVIYNNNTKTSVISEDIKDALKAELLDIVKDPNLEEKVYQEILEIIKLFIDEEFPSSWPEFINNYLNGCISHLFDACCNFSNYSEEDKVLFNRFLNLYLSTMKKANTAEKRNSEIVPHLVEMSNMTSFTDFTKSEFDPENGWDNENSADPSNTEAMCTILKIDKLTLMIMQKSFSLDGIRHREDIEVYLSLMNIFCNKLYFCVKSIKSVKHHIIQNPQALCTDNIGMIAQNSLNNLNGYCKMILKYLKKILGAHPLLFIQVYKNFLEICFDIFFECNLFSQIVLRKAVKVIQMASNFEENKWTERLQNFPAELNQLTDQHADIFTTENIRRIASFLAINFLTIGCTDFYNEVSDYSGLSLLPDTVLCEKLCLNFLPTMEEWIIDCLKIILKKPDCLSSILREEIDCQTLGQEQTQAENQHVEDAIFVMIGLLPKVYTLKNVEQQNWIEISHIMEYLESKIHNDERSMFFKLRYCHLLSRWMPSFDVPRLLKYLDRILILLANCSEKSTDLVVRCINLVSSFLNQLKNFEIDIKDTPEMTSTQADHLDLIVKTVNYQTIFNFLISSKLFSENYTSNLSPSELHSLTDLMKTIINDIDLNENADGTMALLEYLDFIADSHKINWNTESEIISIWEIVLRSLRDNAQMIHNALLKLEVITENKNFQSFWILDCGYQNQNQPEGSTLLSIFIQNARCSTLEAQVETRIIKVLSKILIEFCSSAKLKTYPLLRIKTDIVKYLSQKLVLHLQTRREVPCIFSSNSEIDNQTLNSGESYTDLFTESLILCSEEICSSKYHDETPDIKDFITCIFNYFNIGLTTSCHLRRHLFSQRSSAENYKVLISWATRMYQGNMAKHRSLHQIGFTTIIKTVLKSFNDNSSHEIREDLKSLICSFTEKLEISQSDLEEVINGEKVEEFSNMVNETIQDYIVE